jgi:hypothetical protein
MATEQVDPAEGDARAPDSAIEPGEDEQAAADDTEFLAAAVEEDRKNRLWVGMITRFLECRVSRAGCSREMTNVPADDDMSPRVRLAVDKATIAACERLERIFYSDVPTHTEPPGEQA